MTRRPSPIEQMRRLADDGMEPWQIAATLGVREAAVLVALGDPTPPGGAVRAVEAAASIVPVAPAPPSPPEPAPTPGPQYGTPEAAARGRSAVQALRDRVRALGVEPWQIRHWAAGAGIPCPVNGQVPARVIDAWEAAHLVGAEPTVTPQTMADRLVEHVADLADRAEGPGLPQAALLITHDDSGDHTGSLLDVERVQEDLPEQHDHDKPCDRCGTPAGTCCTHCSGWTVDPQQTRAAGGIVHGDGPTLASDVGGIDYVVPKVLAPYFAEEVLSRAAPIAEHVHDPFPVADEHGIWHAECPCGHRWDRQPCTDCGVPIAALWLAQHPGQTSHPWHAS